MIINTYTTRPVNGMGLGDFIRGNMALYQVCAQRNIPFAVDFSQHAAGAYLVGHETSSYKQSQKILDVIDVYEDELRSSDALWNKIAPSYSKRKTLRTYCNAFQTFPIEQDCKDFLRNSMTPNSLLQQKILDVCHPSFDHDCYETIHIRTGDPVSYSGGLKRNTIEKLYDEIGGIIRHIKRNTNKQIIVLSDSTLIKYLIAKKFKCYTTSNVTTHLKDGGGDVAGTLADYFIMLNSKKIHQFSNSYHWWGSGFSNSASWINDVPLVPYKLKCFKMEFQQIQHSMLKLHQTAP
jgi:hypothetical protein